MPARPRIAFCALAAALAPFGAAGQLAPPAPVEEAPLVRDAFATGLLTRAEGALEARLWRGADPETLGFLLEHAPARPAGPALGEALRRVLLTSGPSPENAGPSLGGRKLVALARAGMTEEARTIASLSNAPRSNAVVAEALAIADLLDGATAEACRRNAGSGRQSPFWVKLRLLCYATAGEGDAADLTAALLREQGALDEQEDAIFSALAAGGPPKTAYAPRTALELAALRALEIPVGPDLPLSAEAGVLKAVAEDESADPAARVAAANAAAAAGALTPAELQVFYRGFEFEIAEIGDAAARAASRPNDPMSDVLLYQSVRRMSAPEFLRDKAARISEALARADSFARAYAASILYADDIAALEGAIVAPEEALRFAVARMILGDGDGAARWLFSVISGGGVSSLGEEIAMDYVETVNLLAALDPISAEAVAEAAGVALEPAYPPPAARSESDAALLARIVEAGFDAAIDAIPGQAGLAALAATAVAPSGDPVALAFAGQALRAAGLSELRRRMAFELAYQTRLANASGGAGFSGEGDATMDAAASDAGAGDEDGLSPRIKPRSTP